MVQLVEELPIPPKPSDPPAEFNQKASDAFDALYRAVPQMNQQARDIDQIGEDAVTAQARAIAEADAAMGYRNGAGAHSEAASGHASVAAGHAAEAGRQRGLAEAAGVRGTDAAEVAEGFAQAAAQSAADAENRVPMSGPTGAGYMPEGNNAQRPAKEDIPAGVAAVRGNTHIVGDYFFELWNRVTETWDALASRVWVVAKINELINNAIGFTIVYPNGGTAATPATATANSRYVEANPFPGKHVICEVQVLYSGKWGSAGWDGNSGSSGNSYGTRAGQIHIQGQPLPGDVVVQTGANGAAHGYSRLTGGVHGDIENVGIVSAPVRVLVYVVRGAI